MVRQPSLIRRLKKSEESALDAVSLLDRKLDLMEQYTRRNNMHVHGIEETQQEITDGVICKLASEKLGVPLTPADIDHSYRMSSGSADQHHQRGPRPIIVKFCSYRTRALFMKARSKLKGTGIFLNEDLTKKNQKLFHSVRHNEKVARAWSVDGIIFAGIANSSGGFSRKLITCEADITKL